jgi:hypothetical protein
VTRGLLSLGQVAYEAYGEQRAWKVFDGTPMPGWVDQTPELRQAWEAAASAVAAAALKRDRDHRAGR